MIYLQVDSISKAFGDLVLFEESSFTINKEDKVALVARNGAGKTSLMKILTGLDTADAGELIYRNGISIGFLQQDPILDDSRTVVEQVFHSSSKIIDCIRRYEEALVTGDKKMLQDATDEMDHLEAWDYEVKVKQILSELRITNFDQQIATLSGGQRKRVALANVLINQPDILYLDEPTNHLDLEMTEWLEDYLIKAGITMLMVSHDRYFLNRVCNLTLEIDDKKIYSYKGNYTYYLEKREERLSNANAEIDKARSLLRTELEWLRRMPKARTHKSKVRTESVHELIDVASQKKARFDMDINVQSERLGKKILNTHKLTKSFGDLKILNQFNYHFKRGEKAGIVGRNGSGKSTFLNMLAGQCAPDSGRIELGNTVVIGYYKQEGMQIEEGKRVLDVIKEIAELISMADGRKLSAAQMLNTFNFPFKMHQNMVSTLSGGEKRRLYLLTVLMQNPNFLILDEPTNDMDIPTLHVLEDYLQNFDGCLMVVSHDRFFMDKVIDHLFVFEGDAVIRDFPGNYTQYRVDAKQREKLEKKIAAAIETKETIVTPVKEKTRKLSYKEQKEFEQLSIDIDIYEKEKKEIEDFLSSGSDNADELIAKSNRLGELNHMLEEKSERWLELSEFAL